MHHQWERSSRYIHKQKKSHRITYGIWFLLFLKERYMHICAYMWKNTQKTIRRNIELHHKEEKHKRTECSKENILCFNLYTSFFSQSFKIMHTCSLLIFLAVYYITPHLTNTYKYVLCYIYTWLLEKP